MTALVIGLFAVVFGLSIWLIHELKQPLVSPVVDKTKLDSSFDSIQAKEKAASDANLLRFDTEDRLHLLDELNRKPRV
jgi:hypothetical protein